MAILPLSCYICNNLTAIKLISYITEGKWISILLRLPHLILVMFVVARINGSYEVSDILRREMLLTDLVLNSQDSSYFLVDIAHFVTLNDFLLYTNYSKSSLESKIYCILKKEASDITKCLIKMYYIYAHWNMQL